MMFHKMLVQQFEGFRTAHFSAGGQRKGLRARQEITCTFGRQLTAVCGRFQSEKSAKYPRYSSGFSL